MDVDHLPVHGVFEERAADLVGVVGGHYRADVASPGVADIGGLFEAEHVNELDDIGGEITEHISGDGLVGFAVAAIVRGDDVVAILERLGDRCPCGAEPRPAMHKKQVRIGGIAPFEVMHLEALDIGKLAFRHGIPPVFRVTALL